MKLEQLSYLIEIIKAGSVNAASKNVFITQQSLNKSIHSLENEFGFPIFNRTKKGVVLTEKGSIVINGAQAIISRYNQMMDEIEQLSSGEKEALKGKINIHTSPMIGISLMPICYIEYLHSYPNVQVYCQEKYRDDVVRAIC